MLYSFTINAVHCTVETTGIYYQSVRRISTNIVNRNKLDSYELISRCMTITNHIIHFKTVNKANTPINAN